MEIIVNEKPKLFYLAMIGEQGKRFWQKVVGHEIKIGDFTFSVVAFPIENGEAELIISETSTGMKIVAIPYDSNVSEMTATREDTMWFFEEVIAQEYLVPIIQNPRFKPVLEITRIRIENEYGEMPESEEYEESIVSTKSEWLN